MHGNRNMSEDMALVGVIAPSSQAAGEQLSAAINMNVRRRLLATVNVGAVGGAGTVDAQLKASATSGGTYAAVAGTAIAQIATANKQAQIEIKAETLAALGVGPFVKLSVVVTTNAVLTAAEVYGSVDRYGNASDNDLASLASKVVA